MVVNPGYTIYGNVTEAEIPEIVEEHLVKGNPIARLAIQEDHLYNRFFRVFGDAQFFGKQMRITLRNCGIIDPENIDDYLSLRGYEALAKAITEMTPDQVVAEVEKAGLRGRGGAGFPTGRKWKFTAAEKATPKYVICNADEGDPRAAFMDRSAIEGDPHTIVEGMGHRRLRHRRRTRHRLYPGRIPTGDQANPEGHRRCAVARPAGREYPGLGLLVRHRTSARRRGLRLRGRDPR